MLAFLVPVVVDTTLFCTMWVALFHLCCLSTHCIYLDNQDNNFGYVYLSVGRSLSDKISYRADAIQKLSYTLCHTYARSTRAVSIPTPVYCMCYAPLKKYTFRLILLSDAHLVCAKAKLHYRPSDAMALSDAGTDSTTDVRQRYISSYQGLNPLLKNYMWWMVSSFSSLASKLAQM